MELELAGITKRFGSLVANDHIDLSVQRGEIRALLGENGAGKSTLMNVLYGLVQPDEGTILVDDKPVIIRSPKDAIAAKIGMVHQHFMLVPVFTVAENVTLGLERTRALGFLDRRRARADVREMSERYGLDVDPDALIEDGASIGHGAIILRRHCVFQRLDAIFQALRVAALGRQRQDCGAGHQYLFSRLHHPPGLHRHKSPLNSCARCAGVKSQ